MTITTQSIGPYTAGEKPAALVHTFTDSSGTAINLAGYTAKLQLVRLDAAPATANATVSGAATGEVTYAWGASDLTTAGRYQAQFWAGNGTFRFASDIFTFEVQPSVTTAPAI